MANCIPIIQFKGHNQEDIRFYGKETSKANILSLTLDTIISSILLNFTGEGTLTNMQAIESLLGTLLSPVEVSNVAELTMLPGNALLSDITKHLSTLQSEYNPVREVIKKLVSLIEYSGNTPKVLWLNGDIKLNGASIPSINIGTESDLIVIKSNDMFEIKNVLEEYLYRKVIGSDRVKLGKLGKIFTELINTEDARNLSRKHPTKGVNELLQKFKKIDAGTDIPSLIFDTLLRNKVFNQILDSLFVGSAFADLNKNYKTNREFISDVIQTLLEIEDVTTSPRGWLRPINETIQEDDLIIWAHPGIGKTSLYKKLVESLGKDNTTVLDFDTVYKHGPMFDSIPKEELARKEWRRNHPKEWDNLVIAAFLLACEDAKMQGKILLVSDVNLLRMFPDKFDRVINMPAELFVERSASRGEFDEQSILSWKRSIDEIMLQVKELYGDKVVTSYAFMEDLLSSKDLQLVSIASSDGRIVLQGRATKEAFIPIVRQVLISKKLHNLTSTELPLIKIISGGLTGIDLLGLQVAKNLGYTTGGTAPKGFETENSSLYGYADRAEDLEGMTLIGTYYDKEGTEGKTYKYEIIKIEKEDEHGFVAVIKANHGKEQTRYISWKGNSKSGKDGAKYVFSLDSSVDEELLRGYGLVESTDELEKEYKRLHPDAKENKYGARTEANVYNSDGTVYFTSDAEKGSPGMYMTKRAASAFHKPFIVNPTAAELRIWIKEKGIKVLNIAGNRESLLDIEFKAQVEQILTEALDRNSFGDREKAMQTIKRMQDKYWYPGTTKYKNISVIESVDPELTSGYTLSGTVLYLNLDKLREYYNNGHYKVASGKDLDTFEDFVTFVCEFCSAQSKLTKEERAQYPFEADNGKGLRQYLIDKALLELEVNKDKLGIEYSSIQKDAERIAETLMTGNGINGIITDMLRYIDSFLKDC